MNSSILLTGFLLIKLLNTGKAFENKGKGILLISCPQVLFSLLREVLTLLRYFVLFSSSARRPSHSVTTLVCFWASPIGSYHWPLSNQSLEVDLEQILQIFVNETLNLWKSASCVSSLGMIFQSLGPVKENNLS